MSLHHFKNNSIIIIIIIISLIQDEFLGLVPLVRTYINSIDIDMDTRCTIMQYLKFISMRASGKEEKVREEPSSAVTSPSLPFVPSLFPHSFTLSIIWYIGKLMTTASWIRQFLTSHSDYKQDSVISEKMSFDLIKKMKGISEGTVSCPELIGSLKSHSSAEMV